MTRKFLCFDTETTGLSSWKHDIHQIAGAIIVDSKIKEKFDFKLRPINVKSIDPKALDVSGVTKEQIMAYPPASEAKKQLVVLFDKYIDKFDKDDKFFPMGFNVKFDLNFLYSLFKKLNDSYLNSYVNKYVSVDLWQICMTLAAFGYLPILENYKLVTVAKYFDIEIDAHEALSDIMATIKIAGIIKTRFFKKLKLEKLLTRDSLRS